MSQRSTWQMSLSLWCRRGYFSHRVILVLLATEPAVFNSWTEEMPLVGNLFDMPSIFEWLTYMEWSKKYNSDILHLNVAGTSIIILSSLEAANDLLEKRASLYSDRHSRISNMAAKIVISIVYGIDVQRSGDPYVELAEHAGDLLWATEWRRLSRDMREKPFAKAKRQFASGNAPHSFISKGLRSVEGAKDKAYQEQVVQSTAGAMYTAGTGTTVSAFGTFILAMLANPEAQKKAQAEIDSVIGNDPIPHFLLVDDEYRGYMLPGGSIVIPNTWICPGRYMANSSVWITLISILAVFDINKAVGEDGEAIELSYDYFAGLVYQAQISKGGGSHPRYGE
ncbi:cytochrome P450 [Mycena epipterygia]|nr:cytochrome P450 [Mycena epipterygia]